jgi:hypothetical protein
LVQILLRLAHKQLVCLVPAYLLHVVADRFSLDADFKLDSCAAVQKPVFHSDEILTEHYFGFGLGDFEIFEVGFFGDLEALTLMQRVLKSRKLVLLDFLCELV